MHDHDHGREQEHASATAMAPEVAKALVDNHRAFLAFLERRLGDRALAEDILQDAFVRATAKAETLREREAMIAWLYRMLRNAVIDHQRRRASASKALAELATELETERAGTETHGAICACVATLTDTLDPAYREALRRIEIDGVAVKDYALEAGITANHAGVRVFRARDALRKQVMRSCCTCGTHGVV